MMKVTLNFDNSIVLGCHQKASETNRILTSLRECQIYERLCNGIGKWLSDNYKVDDEYYALVSVIRIYKSGRIVLTVDIECEELDFPQLFLKITQRDNGSVGVAVGTKAYNLNS